jgi:hypothetical protein
MSAATSAPTAAQHRQRQLDPKLGLYFAVADQLIPFFYKGTQDADLARAMARSAIQAYGPETRADFANIARTIAFSMAALALLGQAAEEDMTMAEKMRAYGRANALNRSADQSERTMMQRRRYRHAHAEPEPPPPEPDIDEAEIEAAVAQAISQAINLTKSVKTDPPRPTPAPEATKPPTRSPIIRYDNPIPATAQSRTASHRDQLLHHTAIQRLAEQTGHPHPA